MIHEKDSLVDVLNKYDHICWYMSAGADFRPLLFFSEAFYSDFAMHMENEYPADEEKIIPDLFVFSDKAPVDGAFYSDDQYNNQYRKIDTDIRKFIDENHWKDVKKLFLSNTGSYRFEDGKSERRTCIVVEGNPIKLKDIQLIAYFMNVKIISWWYGKRRTWKVPMIYVIGNNDDLYQAINENVSVDSVVIIRPEIIIDRETGYKLARQMDALRTKYLIAEKSFVKECFVDKDLSHRLKEFYKVNKFWASRGPLGWYKWSGLSR